MKKDYTNLLKAIYPLLFLVSLISSLIFTYGVFYDPWAWFGFVPSFLGLIVFPILDHFVNKGFKLKFVFRTKIYKTKLAESLKKFNTTNPEFEINFKKSSKIAFKKSGEIVLRENNDWVYQSTMYLKEMPALFENLNNAIETKGGFVLFIQSLKDIFLDDYEILSILHTDIVSLELSYLISQVFNETYFNLTDNNLSKNFTNENNEKIKKLQTVYDPILFEFADEVKSLVEKIKKIKI